MRELQLSRRPAEPQILGSNPSGPATSLIETSHAARSPTEKLNEKSGSWFRFRSTGCQVGNAVANAPQTTLNELKHARNDDRYKPNTAFTRKHTSNYQYVLWSWRPILHSHRFSGRSRCLCSSHCWVSQARHLNELPDISHWQIVMQFTA